jgi:ribosomal protein S18 acetylase RimI-like enzyme
MKLSVEYDGNEAATLIYYIENSVSYINYINVLEKYRGKGMGTALLWHLYNILVDKKIRYVEFDDCSDLYRNKNNIYIKVGAKYIKDNGPEMRWKIYTKYVKKLKDNYYQSNRNIYKII